jgi:hypothetical protein
VSIQRTGFSPPPNDRHSPHDGLLPSMPTRPISQGGRPASATTHTLSGVSKRPVSAEIRYYHGRRRHPSRSFDATPWHQLGRPAWDASPPGVRRCSPPYLNPRTRQHSLESFKAEPSPHSCAAKLAHPLPSRVTSAPPRSVPSAVVAAPQADRHRHRPTAQRAGATISGTLHYQHLLLRRPHSPSPSPEPYCHLHHHALPTLAQPSPAPPPQPLTCAPPPSPGAAVKDTARTDGRAHGSGRRAAEDPLRPPRQHEVPGRAGGDQARTHREYNSCHDGAPA